MNSPLSYKPSAYYYRQALRTVATKAEAVEIGLRLVEEIERHKDFIRERGGIPPKWFIMRAELEEKQWGQVIAVDFATGEPRRRPDHASGDATT